MTKCIVSDQSSMLLIIGLVTGISTFPAPAILGIINAILFAVSLESDSLTLDDGSGRKTAPKTFVTPKMTPKNSH